MERSISFYYDIEGNFFENDNGYIVYRLYEFVPPNVVFLFYKQKCNMEYWNQELGVTVELIYPLTPHEMMYWHELDYMRGVR